MNLDSVPAFKPKGSSSNSSVATNLVGTNRVPTGQLEANPTEVRRATPVSPSQKVE